MAQTILGGYYADAAGNFHDANGQPLSREAQAQAERHAVERGKQREQIERQWLLAEAQRDPVSRALASVVGQQGDDPRVAAQQARIAELEAQVKAAARS